MKKVLIVEDEKDIAEVIKMAFKLEGFQIEVALSGREGLEKIESFQPDVIVLDIIMEDMDGMTMKKNMKEDIPVIVASACDENTRERIEKEIKVEKWLEKPFEISELIEATENVVSSK